MGNDNKFDSGSQMTQTEVNIVKEKIAIAKDLGHEKTVQDLQKRLNIDNSNIHDPK